MNPITETVAAAAAATAVAASLPPLPPQPHRPSTSCDRHPEEHFTGFCPSCLCERLAVLDPNSSTASTSSSSRNKPPTTTSSALKSIFKNSNNNNSNNNNSSRNRNSFFPELRRTKSFSASKNNEGFSGVFEPQRKSCDVRVRNTLWSLFTQDDERNPAKQKDPHQQNHQQQQQQQHQQEASFSGSTSLVESRNLASSSVQNPVLEDTETESESESESDSNNGKAVAEEPRISNVVEDRVQEIVEEEEEELETEPEREAEAEPELELDPEAEQEDLKPMKDHIDLDVNTKKNSGRDFKEIAGSFWSAASVFSKKLQKWRQKQKLKKRRNGGGGSATLPVEKPIGRQFRETQSEIADYGYGRRSCDTDPRFSLDANRMSFEAGRMSFDDPRMSFDEPRASWDGYLIGRTFPRMPTMVSVVEDPPLPPPPPPPPVHVVRTDTQIPVEEPGGEEEMVFSVVPGGSAQTRDYYSDSSSRRRRSLDRSSSIRKTAAAVVAEIDELKSASNASANSKVSPATVASTATTTSVMDYLNGPKLVAAERERDSNSNSMRDDCSESFELGFRDGSSVVGKSNKKSKRWSKAWNIWGFIHRKGGGNKEEDDDRYSSRANGVERSLSESWQESRGAFNRKVFRSNSSVSWRNSSHNFGIGGGVGVGVGGGGGGGGGGLGGFGSLRKNGGWEANGNGKKKRDEFVLERNRSARYSPNNIDNGLLRFYLTPMRSSSSSSNRRNGGSVKSRSNHAHSIARSVLRLY